MSHVKHAGHATMQVMQVTLRIFNGPSDLGGPKVVPNGPSVPKWV